MRQPTDAELEAMRIALEENGTYDMRDIWPIVYRAAILDAAKTAVAQDCLRCSIAIRSLADTEGAGHATKKDGETP